MNLKYQCIATLLCAGLLSVIDAPDARARGIDFVLVTDEATPIRGWGARPALHNGQVAVLGTEQASDTDGIFVLPADGTSGYTVIMYRGDPVPNNPPREFGLPSNPDIHDGVVAFEGGWQNTTDGIYLGGGGALTVLVDSTVEGGEPKGGHPDIDELGVSFEGIGFFEPPLFKGFDAANVIGLSPDPPPGGGDSFATWDLPFRGPSLGGGFASFAAYVNHADGVDGGVYINNLPTGQLSLIANWETAIPGQDATFEYFIFTDTDGQNVVFEGNRGNILFDGFAGVYMAPIGSDGHGPLTVIAEHDQPTPDGNSTFFGFGPVAIDGDLIVFAASLESDGFGATSGIFGWYDGELFEIIDNADQLSGSDLTAFDFTRRSLDGNQLVFRALYIDAKTFEPGIANYVASIDLGPQGDLDGNGHVGTGDLLQLLAAWGPCDGCPEDLDEDGSVGTSDLLTLLANWG